jgi:phenylacetate-coenzyme A ligase PaaK-like adenylate-forming protein
MNSFLSGPEEPLLQIPMTTATPTLVERLNAAQPVLVQAYPTALDLLVRETRAGRLHIAPRYVESGGELLSERTRRDVREVWGAEIDDCWGLSEGIYAFSCRGAGAAGDGESRPTTLPASSALHLPDDLVIVEPVDVDGNVVPAGEPAAKVYVTNLYNRTQPLIRFEVADALTVLDGSCPCGSAHRRITALTGRNDLVFIYDNDVHVYPMILGFVLEEETGLIEYQVRQTRRGLTIKAVTQPGTPIDRLRGEVAAALSAAGLDGAEVMMERVDRIERGPSGKLLQFIPLPPA